jgi:hypothetical protein
MGVFIGYFPQQYETNSIVMQDASFSSLQSLPE